MGAVNQLSKGLEKLCCTLAEFPDSDAERFRLTVERIRDQLLARGQAGMVPLELGEIPSLAMELPASLRASHSNEASAGKEPA